MPRRRDSYADLAAARAELDNIRSLSGAARAEAAVAALRPGRSPQFVEAVVQLLAGVTDPRIQPALVDLYQHFSSSAGRKLDPGAFVRSALVRAMADRATVDDIPLLEEAIDHFEGGFNSNAGTLRGAALAALDSIDSPAAAFHAVAHLTDAEEGTGEPALTAIRILAGSGHDTALFLAALTLRHHPGLVAEAIRGLTRLPARFILALAETHRDAEDVIQLGLVDLFLNADAWREVRPATLALLRLASLEVFGYAAAAIVAGRKPELVALLYGLAPVEPRPGHLEALVDALAYDTSPEGREALGAAQDRLRKLSR